MTGRMTDEALADSLVASVRAYVESRVPAIVAEVLATLPVPKYLGPWKEATSYPAGSFVSFQGSVWHAEESTSTRPGTGSGWRLAVKRGRGE